jgi:hypothetical protein
VREPGELDFDHPIFHHLSLMHRHGIDSKEAWDYYEQHKGDDLFVSAAHRHRIWLRLFQFQKEAFSGQSEPQAV